MRSSRGRSYTDLVDMATLCHHPPTIQPPPGLLTMSTAQFTRLERGRLRNRHAGDAAGGGGEGGGGGGAGDERGTGGGGAGPGRAGDAGGTSRAGTSRGRGRDEP